MEKGKKERKKEMKSTLSKCRPLAKALEDKHVEMSTTCNLACTNLVTSCTRATVARDSCVTMR
jgi:hypothetical protein